jgi:tRNA-splicing ligase RtcB
LSQAVESKTKIFGEHDEATLKQIETCVEAGGECAVLCADGHKGYAQPIGGVVAYKDKISLSGVGYDIACGNLAIRTDITLPQIQSSMARIMDDVVAIFRLGSAGRARHGSITSCLRTRHGNWSRCAD